MSGQRESKSSIKCSSTLGSMYDEKNRKIPRPMNAFMIFAAENRANFKEQFPDENNKEISVRLGESWRQLSKAERETYYEKAKLEEREHKKKYPNYVYCPGVARQRKKERLAEKARLDAILKAEIDSVLRETRSRQLGNPPSSPDSLTDMDLFSFGQPYPQAGATGPTRRGSHSLFPSPRGRGGYDSPYRTENASSDPRHHPFPPRRGRLLPISHFTQPMPPLSQPRPFYRHPYNQMTATYPRQMPPLRRAPYPYPMRHGRPPYMMQRPPYFEGALPGGPGSAYRPWQPPFSPSQNIFEVIPTSTEGEQHSVETLSQAEDARQGSTPSETSQDNRPDVFMRTTAGTITSHEATGTEKTELYVQIPIVSSNTEITTGRAQQLEFAAGSENADNSKQATLLSLSESPYNLVLAHYPQTHFGTPERRHLFGDTNTFAPGSNIATAVPCGNMTAASDLQGFPQFYAMKCTPSKNGEVGEDLLMSPFRLEQPFFNDRPANETTSPFFIPKQIPNEFIEQIAKQFYLLQNGEKLFSPKQVSSPSQARNEDSTTGDAAPEATSNMSKEDIVGNKDTPTAADIATMPATTSDDLDGNDHSVKTETFEEETIPAGEVCHDQEGIPSPGADERRSIKKEIDEGDEIANVWDNAEELEDKASVKNERGGGTNELSNNSTPDDHDVPSTTVDTEREESSQRAGADSMDQNSTDVKEVVVTEGEKVVDDGGCPAKTAQDGSGDGPAEKPVDTENQTVVRAF